MATAVETVEVPAQPRRKNIQFSIRTDSATKARVEQAARVAQMSLTEFVEAAVRGMADEVLARQDQILLTDRDFQLFKELLTQEVDPNPLVRSEVNEFNQGQFDSKGRYHW